MQRKWRRDWERSKANYKKDGLINPLKMLAKSIFPPVAAAGILLSSMSGVYANPTGGQVVGGAGTIAENGNNMTITQNTGKLDINWDSFSIGTGEKVQFIQPGTSSIALNRVLGNDASSIYGQLTANGQVFLINPNGVLFAPGAQVNVGGIVASTLNISDSDFMAGNYKFTGRDGTLGTVVNQGTITAANGGYVAFLGPQVNNEGIIVAQQGTVALGAGKAITLDLDGDGLLSLAVDQAAVDASAANHNLIQADGGLVIMAARAANDLAGTVLNNTGIIEARSLSNVNGEIIFDGGTTGTVINSGTLDASGKNAGETGGTIKVLGDNVTLADGAKMDVSGESGGGSLTIKANNDINVNAVINTGNGNVVLRADGDADSSGTVAFGTSGKVVSDGTVSIYYNPVSYADAATQSTTVSGWYPDSTGNWVYGTTTSNPYKAYVSGNLTAYMLVNTLNDLQNINTNLSGVYALGKDIDASTTSGWNNGAGFKPLGYGESNSDSFRGIFDGDGHVISGLYINSTGNERWIGLFGYARYATFRNVGLENVNITSNGLMVNGYKAGSLVASSENSIFTNCYSTGTVTGNVNATVGGLVGQDNSSQISDCYSTVTVNANNNGIGNGVGGLVGDKSNGYITNCYSTGAVNVKIPAPDVSVGGLVGTSGSTISNCFSTGAVSVTNAANKAIVVGGLVGTNYTNITNSYTTSPITINGGSGQAGGFAGLSIGSITNSYSTGLITINGSGNTVGGFVGSVTKPWATGTITDSYWDTQTSGISDATQGVGDVASAAGLTGMTTANLLDHTKYAGTWDFNNTWYMIDGHTRPFLRSEYSTTITNAHQLQLMVMDLNASYSLGRNIDMSGYAMAPLGGFASIGSAATAFTGTLDGKGYAVDGLTITSPMSSAVGLFGYINEATISNVGLSGVNITGGAGNAYVGSLVGYNDGGSITNACSTGTVSGATIGGGLVGLNNGSIKNSYSATDVSSTNVAGGLAGTNTGSIAASYSTGTVTGNGADSKAGGLVGINAGSITNTYSASAVSTNGGTAGGLVSYSDGGTVTASVWATDIAGQAATAGVGNDPLADGVTGMTTANMKNHANYDSNWDFANTWFTIDGASLPFLRSEYSTTINNAHQLQLIAMDLSADYVLGSNINLSGYKMGPDGFVVLGSEITPFAGSLKGSNYAISGLNLTNSTATDLGLFGYTQGAAISDVKLTNVNIVAGTNNLNVGSLVGYSGTGTSITNCTSSGTIIVSGDGSTVGGLAGYNAGSIENSANTATVTVTGADSNVGGLAGLNATRGSITNSYNAAAVTASGIGSKVGGLVGINNSSVSDSIKSSYNTGTVTSKADGNNVGGLVGENAGNITLSYNEGVVATTSDATNNSVGGLAGKNSNTLTNSYNIGTVTATGANSSAGGLAGWNTTGASVANAYSIGVVTGTAANTTVGGLIGKNDGNIAYAYSVGGTTGSGTGSSIGGLVGANNGTFDNVYWNTETTGQSGGFGAGSAAGAQGLTTAEMMQSTNYTNWDANTWSIVDGISLPYLNWQYSSTPRFISGVVQGGGIGKTLDLVYWNTVMAQPVTIGANGFYYLVLPSSSPVSNGSRVLLYVTGDSNYKANSMYVCTGKGLANADLVKDTLIVDGGSTVLGSGDLHPPYLDTARFDAKDNLLFSTGVHLGYGIPLKVNGNFIARNYSVADGDSIIATGSITIQSAYDILMNRDRNKLGGYQDADAQFIAGGDINITTSGNFIIRPGYTTSTQLSAGGNITIVTGGQFINYSGPDAFKLTGNGRWLVYTTEPVIYAPNTALFYYARFPWIMDWAQRNRFVYSDDMIYAVRGGLTSDFVLWNSTYGATVPATGNGFVYTAIDPLSLPQTLTPRQVMRQEAITAAHTDNAQRLGSAVSSAAPGSSEETLPFLTIIGEGVAVE